jgi:hypothetical protein
VVLVSAGVGALSRFVIVLFAFAAGMWTSSHLRFWVSVPVCVVLGVGMSMGYALLRRWVDSEDPGGRADGGAADE